MKNYYDLKKQLELCQIKLQSLLERKESLNTFLSPKTINYENVFSSGGNSDPYVTYVQTKMNLDNQINSVTEQIQILESNIAKMDKVIRGINNIKYRIFVYRFLDGLSVADIARKTHFSTRRIYQILRNIEKTLDM